MTTILKNHLGCDFVLQLGAERKNTKIKLLQLTDMQFIDSTQCRRDDRISEREKEAWTPESFDPFCGDHIRSVVTQTHPDLIFLTGDLVYGEFDDNGSMFDRFCTFMDSFAIPWAPVFGNHDNESLMGVDWQCERLLASKYCVFARGSVSGNGNYTVGIAAGDELLRVMYMLDSNGCRHCDDPKVCKEKRLYRDQLEWLAARADEISAPGFCCFHVPTADFQNAMLAKGYGETPHDLFTIGVTVPQKDDDFGCQLQPLRTMAIADLPLLPLFQKAGIDGVFIGHYHSVNTSIRYKGIRWTFGLKTGQYDHHEPGQIGGTLITLEHGTFDVAHVTALVPSAPVLYH